MAEKQRVIPPHENISGEEWLRGTYNEIMNYIRDNSDVVYNYTDYGDLTLALKLSILLGIRTKTINQYLETLEGAGRIKKISKDNGVMFKVIK